MSLSKPVYDFLGFYFEQLFMHPLRTKAITSSIIAATGNLASQYLEGRKVIDQRSVVSYGVYGLLFGGTLPHYFYLWIDRFISSDSTLSPLYKLLIERLLYAPVFHAFSLYILARLEGKNHNKALGQLETLYVPILLSSWKYITIIQVLNFTFVPPMLRVLLLNIVGFVWTIYLANKRRSQEQQKGN